MDYNKVAQTPEEFGFTWIFRTLSTDHGNVQVCDNAPLPQISDLAKFIETFGDARVKEWLQGGQSLRVGVQSVLRDACISNIKIRKDLPALKLLAVEKMFGVKTGRATVVTVTVKKYLANDGESEFDSLEEVKIFNKMLAEAEARIEAGNPQS